MFEQSYFEKSKSKKIGNPSTVTLGYPETSNSFFTGGVLGYDDITVYGVEPPLGTYLKIAKDTYQCTSRRVSLQAIMFQSFV